MLTLDDANTLIEKYKDAGFWHQIKYGDVSPIIGKTYKYDFCELTIDELYGYTVVYVTITNSLWNGWYYHSTVRGGISYGFDLEVTGEDNTYLAGVYDADRVLNLYLTLNPINGFELKNLTYGGFKCISPRQIPIINGEYDNKFYIKEIYDVRDYYIDNEKAEYHQGPPEYIILPEAEDCTLGITINGDTSSTIIPCYNLSFKEFKSLPNMSAPTLYKGTPQQIRIYNEDTEEYITEFQAYYKGRKLKDNIIELPSNCPNVVDIVVDLHDPDYVESTVKLKAPTTLYTCTNQDGVETALAKGIKTINISPNQASTEIRGLIFNDMDIRLKGTLVNCTLNNCKINITLNSRDGGNNLFNNCELVGISSSSSKLAKYGEGSVFNDCYAYKVNFTNYKLLFDGTLDNCMFDRTVIISDNDVEITNSRFIRPSTVDYFPGCLYLTGDYIVRNNIFDISGTWQEPAFNMCIIKTNPGFNPSGFIANNTLDLSITYAQEPKNTFYYCLVDDDKIYARRLN